MPRFLWTTATDERAVNNCMLNCGQVDFLGLACVSGLQGFVLGCLLQGHRATLSPTIGRK